MLEQGWKEREHNVAVSLCAVFALQATECSLL